MKRNMFILTSFIGVWSLFQTINAQMSNDLPNDIRKADTTVLVGKLDNGFTYYIRRHNNPQHKVEMQFIVKAGSLNEDEDQAEIAHLTEHMAFNGTKHYPGTSITDYFKKNGVQYGATTGDTRTTYNIAVDKPASGIINNCLIIMRDWAQELILDSLEIDKERGVIIAEHTKSESESGRLEMELTSKLLNHPKYPADPNARKKDNIKSFKHASLVRFYKDWYRPDLEAIVVVGDIDVKETEKMIKSQFSDLQMPSHPRKNINKQDILSSYAVPLTGNNQFLSYQKQFFGTTIIELFLKKKSSVHTLPSNERLKQVIRDRLFNQLMTGRAKRLIERYNSPLSQVSCNLSRNAFHSYAGIDAIRARVELNNDGDIEIGFKNVLEELQEIKKNAFKPFELSEAKQALLVTYRASKAFVSRQLANSYANHFVTGVMDIDSEQGNQLAQGYINTVTLAEMNKLAQAWIDLAGNRAIVVRAPVGQENLPTSQMIDEWIKQSRYKKTQQVLSQYDEIKQLMADTTVLARADASYSLSEFADLGVTQVILANGIRILLKPFKPAGSESDKILLEGFKKGGISLYNNNEKVTARYACSIVEHAGVADYDMFQLNRYLSPKGVSVGASISDSLSSIGGRCNKSEMEVMLQCLYLRLTKPRKDNDAYRDWKARQSEEQSTHQSEYSKRFLDFLFANSYLADVSRTEDEYAGAASIDQQLAYRIYKERFIDTGGWTFVLTGDFQTTTVIPLLVKYLTPLPGIVTKPNERITTASTKDTDRLHRQSKNLYLGNDEKAVVQMFFPNMMAPGLATRLKLELLGNVLSDRVWARLREKESAVYILRTGTTFSKGHDDVYAFNVYFLCEPEKVDYLKAAVMEEFKNIRINGIDAELYKTALGKTKGNTLLNDLTRNRFWLDYIAYQFQVSGDLSEVLKRETILADIIDLETINAAAKKYMDDRNVQSFVWLPERLNPNK